MNSSAKKIEKPSAFLQIPAEGNMVNVNGFNLYYEIYGEGEPLLLIHGFGGSMSTWYKFLPELKKHNYKLILVDLRGHGRSTNPSGDFTHRQCAYDMFALLDYLNIKSVKAMGISTGGMTLIHMATQQPDRIERMVPIIATIYFPESARADMRMSPERLTPEYLQEKRKIHFYSDEQIKQLTKNFYDFAYNYDDMNFTKPYLSTIKAKTLIVYGDRDPLFPVDIGVEMYNNIPGSYLFVAPNTGHDVPIPGSGDENVIGNLFLKCVLQFLNGEWDKTDI